MSVRQTRIFVPPTAPFDEGDWVCTVVGHVVAPVSRLPGLGWFQFNRYVQSRADSGGDCDISGIPEGFGASENGGRWTSSGATGAFRSIRFRYRIDDGQQAAFEGQVRALITAQGCAISDFRDFDLLGDYGGERFRDAAKPHLSADRGELMGQFLCAVTKLFLHGLVGPDAAGRFSQEPNTHQENPLGSRFESVHHLFCNMVEARLPVMLTAQSPWMGSGPVGGSVVLTF